MSLATVAARLGRRALVCTDERFAATAAFAEIIAALRGAGDRCPVHDRVQPDVPRDTVAVCVEPARAFAPDLVIGIGGGSCLDMAKCAALLLDPRRPLAGLLRRVQGARSRPAADRGANHSRHRLGGHPGRGDFRSRPDAEGRHLQPASDPGSRDLRPGTDDDLPAGADGDRRRRRADPRHRGVHRRPARARPRPARRSMSSSARARSPTILRCWRSSCSAAVSRRPVATAATRTPAPT